MDLEVVTVGTELLLGFTLDSNAAEVSQAMASIGAVVTRRATVGDDRAAIRAAVADGLNRTGFVIVTGGLGPTRDDVTKHAVADVFDAPLDLDASYLEKLERRFEQLRRGPMPESNRTQALVPRGGTMLRNPKGTAPGLWLESDRGTAVMLPGVPHEMRWLLEHEVVPRCRERDQTRQGSVTRSRTLRTTGIAESKLAVEIAALEERIAPVTLAYLPTLLGVDLRLTAWQLDSDAADGALERAVQLLRPVLGVNTYGEGAVDLAAVILDSLRRAGIRIAVAESCTGGLVGARITDVPGASERFAGGVISYDNESKTRDLDVAESLLDEVGAVSEPVAQAMADGVCRRFRTEVGIAVTGIAGPEGGTEEKPVGTVCFGVRLPSGCRTLTRWFPGGRSEVRARAAQAALDAVRRALDGE